MMEIIIDDREDKRRIKYIQNFFPNICTVNRLDTGDIIILQDNKPTIAIEVKTVEDFISSMKNRRLHDEILRMKQKYPYSFLLVYGDWKDLNSKYYKYKISDKCRTFVEMTMRYKVYVFWALTQKEFATTIEEIIKQIDKKDKPIEPPTIRVKKTNPFVNVLIGIAGVGEKTALKLLDYFKTPGGVFNASESELKKVPRLGKKIISEILRMKDPKEKE